MKKLFRFALAAIFILGIAALPMKEASALYGLKYWHVTFYDQQGDKITSGLTVTVRTVDTTTAATIYSDENATAMTNAFDPGTDGIADWWSSTSTLDVYVTDGESQFTLQDATVNNHRIVLVKTDATEGIVQLPINQFYTVWSDDADPWDAEYVLPLAGDQVLDDSIFESQDSSSGPTLRINRTTARNIVAIVWDDGDVSQVETSFRVPPDYSSGGGFRVWMANSDLEATEPSWLDYAYFVNDDSSTEDETSTAETAIECTSMFDDTATSENEYDLSISESLSAGDLITLRLWRADGPSGTADLEVFHVTFYYSRKH